MKLGYLPTEATSMYRSLAREASEFWGWGSVPDFSITSDVDRFGVPIGAIASTNFAPWDTSILQGITFNAHYLPYLYEDELLVILLHEFAHVEAGLDAWHDDGWARLAVEIGSVPEPAMCLRQLWDNNIPWLTMKQWERDMLKQPTLGTL